MAASTYTSILYRGTKATLPTAVDGNILLATDTEELFIDYGQSHIKISDIVTGMSSTQIVAIQSPLDKIYVASDTQQLYYYDSTAWVNISINHTHSIADITDLSTSSFVTVVNIDSTEGLDFGNEDAVEESEE